VLTSCAGMEHTKRQFCVCASVADYECSRCENQGYCSEACQKRHWPQHSRLCFPPPKRPVVANQAPRPLFQKRMVPAPIRPRVSIASQHLESSSESETDDRRPVQRVPLTRAPRTIQTSGRAEPIAIPVTLPQLVASTDEDSDGHPTPPRRVSTQARQEPVRSQPAASREAQVNAPQGGSPAEPSVGFLQASDV
jgi:hypothetical protein